MKKIAMLIVLMLSITVNTYGKQTIKDSIVNSAAQAVTSSGKVVYEDLKSAGKDLKGDIEDILHWSVSRTDTVLSKGVKTLSNTALHTYDILKMQQLVKSIHHLFFWILGVILSFVFFQLLNTAIKQGINDGNTVKLLIIGILTAILWFYNTTNFMEMWTGFINPEYGAIMEIIHYLKR